MLGGNDKGYSMWPMCVFLFIYIKGINYYYVFFFPSGKYMAWLVFFYLFHLSLSVLFSS